MNIRDALTDPSFRAALASRGLNRLPYLPPLRRLVRLLLGPAAFSYPAKVLRTVYPEPPFRVTKGRYVHQDFVVSGVQDMLTTWLPLMDIPVQLGGLAVLPGSHLGPPLRPRLLRADEPRWATTDYQPGDVLLFHCLTSHAALPNHASRLRISTDVRWQPADQPAPAELVLGPGRADPARPASGAFQPPVRPRVVVGARPVRPGAPATTAAGGGATCAVTALHHAPRLAALAPADWSRPLASPRPLAECGVEILDQIVGGLDADRQAHQVGGHLKRGAGHRGMGHPGRVLDQRLHPAERLTQGEQPRAAADLDSLARASPGPERHHAAEPAHLLGGYLVARMQRPGRGSRPH